MASKEWAVELRPTELDKMLGMQVNGKIVQGWIDNDAIPNSVIFYGKSGTGKTTLSRAIAHLVGAELVELDAASHNGVDDARQINELASRLSLTGTHKIFLIDEAHMLTTAAFNALLKNIEEPNPKCHFFWATTDYSKLPNTIKGRSRMLKFYSVPKEELKDYALAVLEYKGYTLKDEVIDIIVSRSYGQVRDMLKLLQTACEGNLNSVDAISKFLAIPDSKGMRTFINGVLSHAPKTALSVLLGINTDLIEWVRALQTHIYELLEDKYGVKQIYVGDNITLKNQIQTVQNKFTDKQFGALLSALNKITSPDTAFAELYALLFKGVD